MPNSFQEKSHETYALFTTYVEKKLEILKLEAIDVGSKVLSKIIASVLLVFLSLFFLIFSSIAVSIFIGRALDNLGWGFLIVAGFYLLLAILIVLFKKQFLYTPIINAFIKKSFKNDGK